MIGKIAAGGRSIAGLLRYLYGPGRADEHLDPHLVAGWRDPADLEPHMAADGSRDLAGLVALLEAPAAASVMSETERAGVVWHCVVRAAPEDPELDDETWAQIGQMVMDRLALAPHGQRGQAVRWVMICHGDNHAHLVATLARQDLRRPSLRNDRYLLQAACADVERQFGLRVIDARDRSAARALTRAEMEQVRTGRRKVATRVALRRAVLTAAATATGEQEFFTLLAEAGISVQQRPPPPRPSHSGGGRSVGYSVGRGDHTDAAGQPVWFSGGALAPDLTLPKLQQRWQQQAPTTPAAAEPAAGEPTAAADTGSPVCDPGQVGAILDAARETVCARSPAADDVAWATSDVLHVLASCTGEDGMWVAADCYDRAARPPFGRLPPPSRVGDWLRQLARQIAAGHHPVRAVLGALGRLIETIADLRWAQQRTVPAGAARRSAEHLHAAAASTSAGTPVDAVRRQPVRQPSRLGTAEFPRAPKPSSLPKSPIPPATRGTTPPHRRPPKPPGPAGPSRP